MGRAYRLHPDHGGAHRMLRHPGVLLLRGRLLHRVRAQAAQQRRRRAWLAVQAVRPVGRPRGLAAVLGVAYQRVQLRGGHPRSEKPAQAGFHGPYGVAAGAGGVCGRVAVQREQHAVHGHAAEVLQRRRHADQRGQHAGYEFPARALGHGHSSAYLVRGLCGPDHPVRLCHRRAHRERSVQGMGGAQPALCPVLVVVPGHRHRPWRRVGLRGARLGRLLGLGRRGKRQPAVVAGGRGAHP